MNSPSCQTTSQMRGVGTSLVFPSFENMLLFTPIENQSREKGKWALPSTVRNDFNEWQLRKNSVITNQDNHGLVRTPHNIVILLRLARRACFSEVAYVTSKMLCPIPKTINHP